MGSKMVCRDDPPFVFDPSRDEFIEIESSGLPLCIVRDERYTESRLSPLPAGSVLLISTDGVWEAQNEQDEQFGKERVCELIRANANRPASEIAARLNEALAAFCGEARQLDDITFVVVRRIEAVGGGDAVT